MISVLMIDRAKMCIERIWAGQPLCRVIFECRPNRNYEGATCDSKEVSSRYRAML